MTDLEAMIRAVIFVSGCSEQEAPEAAALVLREALGSLPPLPRPPWYQSKGAYRQRLADRVARRAHATSAPPTTGAPTWGPNQTTSPLSRRLPGGLSHYLYLSL